MDKPVSRPIFAVSGPTCSGKTALGVRLARHVGGEVVNFDSVQIYRDIEIATAKPTPEEMQDVPHHLIGYVDPSIDYTAADWAGDASEKIRDIEVRGRTAVLVGGTGFYLRTLRRPLFESPKTDRDLRERLRALRSERGSEHLHRMLSRVDPAAAEAIQERDHMRTMRALEHFFQTGIRISDVWSERPAPPDFDERIRLFVLRPDRKKLYEKINARTAAHFEAGLVDEVKHLLAKGVNEYGNALGAHAYRRVCEYLRGERTLESAIERSQQDVRNYAKRQLTWFRKEEGAIWLDGFGEDDTIWEQLIERL